MRKAQLADYVANRRKQKKEQGREGSNFEESGSRGIREEATEIYSDPVHRVGDLVMILKDTRPGVSFKSSYDKEGRVIEAIDGKGSGPNLYVVKLLHEHGTEKVDELWLVPIDYCGSVMSTRRKKGTKRYLDNKNVVISDLMGRNAVLRKKLKDRDIQLEEQRKVKELYEKQNHNMSAMIAEFLTSSLVDMEGGSHSNTLVQHVAKELSWEYSKIKKSEARSISELRWQKSRTLALEECTARQKEVIEDLTAELKFTLKKSAEGNKELRKRRKDVERLSKDNALLREESTAFILDDPEKEEVNEGSYSRNKGDALSDELRMLILKLYRMRLSTEQVRRVLEEMMTEMNIGEFQLPSYGALVALRSDLAHVCDVLAAIKLAKATRWLQLGHDGSAIKGRDTTCVSVIVQYDEGECRRYEKLILSSSFLCEDKTAEVTANGIVRVVERLKEKYGLFLQELGEEEAARYPPLKEIGFHKMVNSSLMSDNNVTALNVSIFLMDFIEASVREYMQSEGEWDQLTEEERRDLCSVIQTRCFAHIRCLCANDGVIFENEWLKGAYVVPEGMRADGIEQFLKPELNSVIYALQKYLWDESFDAGYSRYADFQTWIERREIDPRSLGRKGTGSRMDKSMQLALDLALMYEHYLTYTLQQEQQCRSLETNINKSIRLRLMHPHFKAAMLSRARLYLKVYYPFRNLCQGKVENPIFDVHIHDMGKVVDKLYEKCEALVEDPTLLDDPNFVIFNYHDFPFLREFDRTHRKPEAWHERVREAVYRSSEGEDDDSVVLRDLINEVTILHARGIMKALDHNCKDWLTRCDGKYSFTNWSDEMKADSEMYSKENISLCESVFALFDMVYRFSDRFRMDTADGVVRAAMSGLFDDDEIDELMTKSDRAALLAMIRKNRKLFKAQHDEDLERQKQHKLEANDRKQREAQVRLARGVENSLSVFFLPRIKSEEELRAELGKHRSNAAKERVLTKQLKVYTDGFLWTQYKEALTRNGKKVTVPELTDRLIRILNDIKHGKIQVPQRPTSHQADKIIERYIEKGYKVVSEYKSALKKQLDDAFPDLLRKLEHLTSTYSPEIPSPFDQLKEVVWPRELNNDEKLLKRGVRVQYSEKKNKRSREDVMEFHTVLGLVWDDEEQTYFVNTWKDGTEKPKSMKEVTHYAYTTNIVDESGTVLTKSIFEFDNFRVLDEL